MSSSDFWSLTQEYELGNRTEKPWGYERLLVYTPYYCMKELFIRAGRRTSFQYHKRKIETIYVVSGIGEIELYQHKLTFPLIENSFFHIPHGRYHRLIAGEDLTLVEASTSELEDIVRVEDDYGR